MERHTLPARKFHSIWHTVCHSVNVHPKPPELCNHKSWSKKFCGQQKLSWPGSTQLTMLTTASRPFKREGALRTGIQPAIYWSCTVCTMPDAVCSVLWTCDHLPFPKVFLGQVITSPNKWEKKKWGRKAGARNRILSITTAQAVLGKDSFSGLELYNATGHNCVECPAGTKESGTSQSDPTLEAWVSHGEKPLP